MTVTVGILMFKRTNIAPSDFRDAPNSGTLSDLPAQSPGSVAPDIPLPASAAKMQETNNTRKDSAGFTASCGTAGTLKKRIADCLEKVDRQATFCGSDTAVLGKLRECSGSLLDKEFSRVWHLVTRTNDKEVWLELGGEGHYLWAFDDTTNPKAYASAMTSSEICGNFREEYFGKFRLPSYNDIKRAGLLDHAVSSNKWFRFFKPNANWYVTLDGNTIKVPRVNASADSICISDVASSKKETP